MFHMSKKKKRDSLVETVKNDSETSRQLTSTVRKDARGGGISSSSGSNAIDRKALLVDELHKAISKEVSKKLGLPKTANKLAVLPKPKNPMSKSRSADVLKSPPGRAHTYSRKNSPPRQLSFNEATVYCKSQLRARSVARSKSFSPFSGTAEETRASISAKPASFGYFENQEVRNKTSPYVLGKATASQQAAVDPISYFVDNFLVTPNTAPARFSLTSHDSFTFDSSSLLPPEMTHISTSTSNSSTVKDLSNCCKSKVEAEGQMSHISKLPKFPKTHEKGFSSVPPIRVCHSSNSGLLNVLPNARPNGEIDRTCILQQPKQRVKPPRPKPPPKLKKHRANTSPTFITLNQDKQMCRSKSCENCLSPTIDETTGYISRCGSPHDVSPCSNKTLDTIGLPKPPNVAQNDISGKHLFAKNFAPIARQSNLSAPNTSFIAEELLEVGSGTDLLSLRAPSPSNSSIGSPSSMEDGVSLTSRIELVLERARWLAENKQWSKQPEVVLNKDVHKMEKNQIMLQEVIFEIVTSEATYHLNLATLVDTFMDDPQMAPHSVKLKRRTSRAGKGVDGILDRTQYSTIFSNAKEIRRVSARFFNDIQKLITEDIFLGNIFFIIQDYAENQFSCYERYCASQKHRLKELRECVEKNESFRKHLQLLEERANQTLQSLIAAPLQRITKLPLLMSEILKRIPKDDSRRTEIEHCFKAVGKVADLCDEGAGKVEDLMDLDKIRKKLHFGRLKPCIVVSLGRKLKKEGTIDRLKIGKRRGRMYVEKQPLYIYVFTDLLIITTEDKDK